MEVFIAHWLLLSVDIHFAWLFLCFNGKALELSIVLPNLGQDDSLTQNTRHTDIYSTISNCTVLYNMEQPSHGACKLWHRSSLLSHMDYVSLVRMRPTYESVLSWSTLNTFVRPLSRNVNIDPIEADSKHSVL